MAEKNSRLRRSRTPSRSPLRTQRPKTDAGNARLRSGLSIIPSLFTIGNIFCGYYAVIATLKGNYDYAAIAIGLGIVLDGLDGRVARLTKTTSEFGVQLDSLADVLTFGIAPAMLAFSWGIDAVAAVDAADMPLHVRHLGWLATFGFVICGALRLARFNVLAQRPADASSKRYFVGLPIPAGAGLIAAIVHFFKVPPTLLSSSLLWAGVVLLLAFLMISRIRYYSFKEFGFMRRGARTGLAGTAMLIGLIIFYSEIVLLIMSTVYVASGMVSRINQIVRRIPAASDGASEPAHGNIES